MLAIKVPSTMKFLNTLRSLIFTLLIINPIAIKAEDNLKQDDLVNALTMMRNNGSVSESDYNKALIQIKKMNQKEILEIQKKASDIIEKDPQKLEEMKKQSGIQF